MPVVKNPVSKPRKARKASFQSEAELAEVLIEHLEVEGWEVFKEVGSRGSFIDIVARNDDDVMVIETKTSFTMAVIEQVWHNRTSGHYLYVGVPYGTGPDQHSWMWEKLKESGIGIFWVATGIVGTRQVHTRLAATRRPTVGRDLVLHEGQKASIAGGAGGANRCTPFSMTRDAFTAWVQEHPGGYVREAAKVIKHHYGAPEAATSAISGWLRTRPELFPGIVYKWGQVWFKESV
jgi:hypothetical protein